MLPADRCDGGSRAPRRRGPPASPCDSVSAPRGGTPEPRAGRRGWGLGERARTACARRSGGPSPWSPCKRCAFLPDRWSGPRGLNPRGAAHSPPPAPQDQGQQQCDVGGAGANRVLSPALKRAPSPGPAWSQRRALGAPGHLREHNRPAR